MLISLMKVFLAENTIHSLVRLALMRRTLSSAEPSLNLAYRKGVVIGNC